MSLVGRCGGCRYWQPSFLDGDDDSNHRPLLKDGERYGPCDLGECALHVSDEGSKRSPSGLTILHGGEGEYGANVRTHASFGCTGWEEES